MHDLPLLTTVAVGFAAAWVLGLIAQRVGLSPIVGYLLAGVAISPNTPGFVGDPKIAHQLAEIGVILLMFGVGLHFHFKDLMAVKRIAVPGAIGQSLAATIAGVLVFAAFGWPLSHGLVLGIAMSVASTVVLMRVLMDANKLNSPEGHAAVGWLIVEDIITVIVLVMIPALAGGQAVAEAVGEAQAAAHATQTPVHWAVALGIALLKLGALVLLVFFAGSKIVPSVLVWVAKLRSRELFTLTVLVLSVTVAVGAAGLFGASVALGAFLAGMVVAQSPVSRQAGADLLPLRDAFAVLFFVSVGMLFDPRFILREPLMVIAGLGIVLILKPLAALVIVAALRYPARTALTVAIGLAQIGEFSFIVSELGKKVGLLNDDGHNVLVAAAIVSITLNPLLFRSIDGIERRLRAVPWLWRMINRKGPASASPPAGHAVKNASDGSSRPVAVIVGYGPAGQQADRLLRDAGMETVVVDLNMKAIGDLHAAGRQAVFGDAGQSEIIEQSGVATARCLVLTMPDAAGRIEIIAAARELNPEITIYARARYAKDRGTLNQYGKVSSVVDEIESAVALSRLVLLDTGADARRVKEETARVRSALTDPAQASGASQG